MKNLIQMLMVVIVSVMAFDAFGAQALVVDVQPNVVERTRYETDTWYEEKCNIARANDRGIIERGNNSIFGSIEGTIGTAVGYGIGNEIGGGSGREISRVLGAIVGNKIGNDIGDRRRVQRGEYQCATVPVTQTVPVTYSEVSHYNVTVEIDGQNYRVQRNFSPVIGSYIDVTMRVR